MQPKKTEIKKPVIISDDKNLLRERLPALAMPNTTNNSSDDLMHELESLMPKWKDEQVR